MIPPDEIHIGLHVIVDAICKTGTFHKVRWTDPGSGRELNASVFGEKLMAECPLGTYWRGKYKVRMNGQFLNVVGVVESPVPIWGEEGEQ